MNVQQYSVGMLPYHAIQAVMAICLLMFGALWWHTHHYGPSILVTGLKVPTVVTLHADNEAYAKAIAKRFVHEYWNWSYTGLLQAKARAAYFCQDAVGASLMREARASNHYYQELLDTCNGSPDTVEVTWSKPAHQHYLVHVTLTVQEWQSFTHSHYPVEGYIEVKPITVQKDRMFRMEVVRYLFRQLADPVRVDDSLTDDPIDTLFNDTRLTKDTVEDHLTAPIQRPPTALHPVPLTHAVKRITAAPSASNARTEPSSSSVTSDASSDANPPSSSSSSSSSSSPSMVP